MKNSTPQVSQLSSPLPPLPLAEERRPVFERNGSHFLRSNIQVIDLTLDDDEDEPMESHITHQSIATVGSCFDSIQPNSIEKTEDKATLLKLFVPQAEASKRVIPLTEDVESDVDEEWPRVPVETAASVSPLVDNYAFHSQTRKDVEATLRVIRKTMPLSLGRQQGKVTRQDSPSPRLSGNDKIEENIEEKRPRQAPQADACSSTTADRIVQIESLEDGEIFEEGAVPKSAIQVNILQHQYGSTGMRLVDAMGIRASLRSKKQKKRGKKKTKRKLETMQAMHALPGQMYPEFERTIRPRPFVDAPSPGHGTFAMKRNGPRGEPTNVPPVFQDASPALFRAGDLRACVLHPPIRHLSQQRPARPLPPPYEDSQILRVNRQGSMEMINGEAKLPLRTTISEPPTYGGFKYRPVSVFPPPPVPHGPGLPLQRSVCDVSRLRPVRTLSGGKPTNSVDSRKRDASGGGDLDSLRAAALRTKTERSLKRMEQTTEAVTAVQASSLSSRSSSRQEHSKEKQAESARSEIDKLRFDILRSMTKNQNRKSLNISLPTPQIIELNATERPGESGMIKAIKNNSSTAPNDLNSSKDPSKRILANIPADVSRIGSDGPSKETSESKITSVQDQAVSKTKSHLAAPSEKTKPSSNFAVASPEFRPLTASSQSLVIQLGPDDYLPRKSGDGVHNKARLSSSLQDAIKEMRRKIAEREKEQTDRLMVSAATRLTKQSSGVPPSSALPTSSSESKVSSIVTQLLSATAACPGITSPGTESMKDSSAGANIDRRISAQTEVNQEKRKAETVRSAAGREFSFKPASEAQLQSQASSNGRNGDSAREPCVKKSLDGVTPRAAKTPWGDVITEDLISNDEPVFGIDHDFDAIRAEYQQCVIECEEAEVHIARLSKEMAQLEKELAPAELTVEKDKGSIVLPA